MENLREIDKFPEMHKNTLSTTIWNNYLLHQISGWYLKSFSGNVVRQTDGQVDGIKRRMMTDPIGPDGEWGQRTSN